MIDWIRITLKLFSGNFDNCQRLSDGVCEETGVLYENYLLPNGYAGPKQHSMHVARQVGRNRVTVKGSIRKWNSHRDILPDLTAKTFEHAIKKLAKKLNIPFEELCYAEFTQCEIGLNVRTAIPAYQITPLVVKYGRLKDKRMAGDYTKTTYFEGAAKKLKLYDKLVEVADNAKGSAANKVVVKDISDYLTDKNSHLLRIEYTLLNKKAFTQHKLGHIKTIGDLITHYADLYEFWCRETNKIVLFNDKATTPDREKLNPKDIRIIDNLEKYGFKYAVDIEQSNINKSAETAPQMLSRAQKKVLTVVGKYYRTGYCTQTLRLDASRHIWSQHSKHNVDMRLRECLRELWDFKPAK